MKTTKTCSALVLGLWFTLSGLQAGAQEIGGPKKNDDGRLPAMLAGGLGLGALGFLGGAVAGAHTTADGSEFSGLAGAIVGGSIGGALALPMGVHSGNRMRGNLPLVTATSIGVGSLGWMILWNTDHMEYLPAVPVLQLVACVAVERKTNSRREKEPNDLEIGFNVGPMAGGGAGLVIGGRF